MMEAKTKNSAKSMKAKQPEGVATPATKQKLKPHTVKDKSGSSGKTIPYLAHIHKGLGARAAVLDIAARLSTLKAEEPAEHQASPHATFLKTFGENPSGSQKELVWEFVDFFDYVKSTATPTKPFRQYILDVSNNIITPSPLNPAKNIGRVEKVKLWALPQFDIDVGIASIAVDFGVPVVQSGAASALVSANEATAAQKGTLLTPTSVSDWVLVGSYDAKSIFDQSNFGPVFNTSGDQVLFTVAVVNPDDGKESGSTVQFMLECTMSQTIAPQNNIKMKLIESADTNAWSQAGTGSVADTPAFIRLKHLRNAL